VPTWSNTAIRSFSGTKSRLSSVVTRLTKSMMARLAVPSFQDGSGPEVDRDIRGLARKL
jgi:hypothetical protein